MSTRAIEEVCTITAKGQTTVPKTIRQAIGVDYGGKIAFRIEEGQVTLHRVEAGHDDPAVASFLKLIENDIAHGRNVEAIPADLVEAMRLVREKVDVDLDGPL
ncbi:MAG TPA: type II toxin-antitoxin system PrlF family antitoxin [Stellaceae bacterium]|nr:type II toxin-antitoxin system PrlF family antitoxin [Stellaceae bacterium]